MNSVPHIGHAFEFILGDAISKHLKSKKIDTHFNIGLDEHGLKVWLKSQELGITPEEHVDNLTVLWKDFCKKFQIDYDSFYKTSEQSHHDKVSVVWDNFIKRGDIYKKSYNGKYCIGCESYKLEKELIDGRCEDHPTTEIKQVEEENYFFKLTKYKENLLDWINKNPKFLEPQSKLDELKNLIVGSEDISISRLKENCPWGIDVPGDSTQIIYVWYEALWNYAFAAGYLTDNFKWDNVIQLCGPDNLRFQAIILQSFLESEGIKKSDKLLVHGTILDKDGRKISKTLGNVIDPIDQIDKYGLYPVRYYALAGLNTYSNSSWNEEDLSKIWNSDIVKDWGNLVSRTLHLIDIRLDGVVVDQPEDSFVTIVDEYKASIGELWDTFKIKEALSKTNELVKYANKYITDKEPWKSTTYGFELSNLHLLILTVNDLYTPVFGSSETTKVIDLIKTGKKCILYKQI